MKENTNQEEIFKNRERELLARERELLARERELDRNPSISEALKTYLNKTLFPDVGGISKIIIFSIEIFHIMFSLISPIGFFMPPKFLIYQAIGLSIVLFGWLIFDGCILTILKSKFFGIDDPLIKVDLDFLKIMQTLFIIGALMFYIFPSKAPFVFLKRGVRFLDSL